MFVKLNGLILYDLSVYYSYMHLYAGKSTRAKYNLLVNKI